MKKISPSQQFEISRVSYKHRDGVHVITTEAQTFNQALDIIKRKADRNRHAETLRKKEMSLGQQISIAKLVSGNKSVTLSTGIVKSKDMRRKESMHLSKRPHPFKDLTEDQKAARARQIFESKSFGIGARAGRKIAELFGVSNEVMSEWLGIEIWKASEFNNSLKKMNR